MINEASRLRWLLGVLTVTTLTVVVVWWPGCRTYPPASSPEALTLMKQLYTACNTRNLDRLTKTEQRANQLEQEGQLTAQERAAVQRIIDQAKAGDWDRAQRESLKYAEDQVR